VGQGWPLHTSGDLIRFSKTGWHCCIERSAYPTCSPRSPRSHAKGFQMSDLLGFSRCLWVRVSCFMHGENVLRLNATVPPRYRVAVATSGRPVATDSRLLCAPKTVIGIIVHPAHSSRYRTTCGIEGGIADGALHLGAWANSCGQSAQARRQVPGRLVGVLTSHHSFSLAGGRRSDPAAATFSRVAFDRRPSKYALSRTPFWVMESSWRVRP
jgi:hypothetical protein